MFGRFANSLHSALSKPLLTRIVAFSGVVAGSTIAYQLQDVDSISEMLKSNGFLVFADEKSNQVYGWGNNVFGQLGGSRSVSDATPRSITSLDGKSVTKLYVDSESVLAITADGCAYTWGQEEEYCLGTGRNASTHIPTQLRLPKVVSGCLSGTHGCAIDYDGNLWVWGTRAIGHEAFAQLPGDSSSAQIHKGLFTKSVADPRKAGRDEVASVAKTPVKLDSALWDHVPVTSVACGLNHTLFTLADGRVFGMGSNYEGALGLGDNFDPVTATLNGLTKLNKPEARKKDVNSRNRGSSLRIAIDCPVEIPALSGKNVVKLSCGKRYSLALTADGSIYSFGEDSYGQLGQTSLRDASRYLRTPTKIVDSLHNVRIVDIASGDSHAAAISNTGAVYIWGLGSDGQIGNGVKQFKNYSPVLNQRLLDQGVVAKRVACGGGHTAVLDSKGHLYMFGRGADGQLGRGKHLESIAAGRPLPVRVDMVNEGLIDPPFNPAHTKVTDVALGTNSSFAVVERS